MWEVRTNTYLHASAYFCGSYVKRVTPSIPEAWVYSQNAPRTEKVSLGSVTGDPGFARTRKDEGRLEGGQHPRYGLRPRPPQREAEGYA